MKRSILVLLFLIFVPLLFTQEYTFERVSQDDPNIFWIKNSNDEEFKVHLYGVKIVEDDFNMGPLAVMTVLQHGRKTKVEFIEKFEDIHYITVTILDLSDSPVSLSAYLMEIELFYLYHIVRRPEGDLVFTKEPGSNVVNVNYLNTEKENSNETDD